MENKNIVEGEAAEALLDVGVSLPFRAIKIPFRKKPFQVRVTMKRPVLGSQIRIARVYLRIGVTFEQVRKFNKEEEMTFMAEHGKDVSRMIALTICRDLISGHLFAGFVAWILRWFVADIYLQAAYTRFASLMGTKSFESIIRSVEQTNPLEPLIQSQQEKGS